MFKKPDSGCWRMMSVNSVCASYLYSLYIIIDNSSHPSITGCFFHAKILYSTPPELNKKWEGCSKHCIASVGEPRFGGGFGGW